MQPTLFYITDKVQIKTAGPDQEGPDSLKKSFGCYATAQFFISGKELIGQLQFITKSENDKIVSVTIKTFIRGVREATVPIEFQELDRMLTEITLAYKGISEILGGAYINGFFQMNF